MRSHGIHLAYMAGKWRMDGRLMYAGGAVHRMLSASVSPIRRSMLIRHAW